MTPAMTPAMTPYASPSMAAATLSPRAMPAFSPLASPALPASDAAPKHATIMQPLQLGGAAVSRRQSQEAAAASLGSTASTPEAMLAAMKLSAAAVVNATGAPTSMNSTAATCPITVIPLKWRQGMTPAQLPVELGGTVVTSTSPKLQPFDPLDVITMCDCIYSEASAIALVDTIHALCERNLQAGAPPPAIHCLSEVRNASAQEMFVEVAEGRGFNVRLVAVDEWHPRVPEECRSDHMNLYLLSWQGAAEEVEVKGQ